MKLPYNVAIRLYWLAVKISALTGNDKAKKWIAGRVNWKTQLKLYSQSDTRKKIWIHAASLGEFEQGRPLIEQIKRQHPQYSIILSFFSPSGYEIRKNYEGADYICYLPLDTPKNASNFIEISNPDIAIFVKYEFWLNYLNKIAVKKIPLYLVSGIFRKDQVFFKGYGSFFRKGLRNFDHIYVQDENSKKLLNSIGMDFVTVAGDTRFDRVVDIKKAAKSIKDIETYCQGKTSIIIGSSWQMEEVFLMEYIEKTNLDNESNFIVAPHNIDSDSIKLFFKKCTTPPYLYSKVKNNIPADCRILIIDSIGLLSSIYAYTDIAIIGGGFGAGIHNILEAAVWSQPVIFGPNYKNFKEAVDLIEREAALVFGNQAEFDQHLNLLIDNKSEQKRLSTIAGKYCEEMSGATEIIMRDIDI